MASLPPLEMPEYVEPWSPDWTPSEGSPSDDPPPLASSTPTLVDRLRARLLDPAGLEALPALSWTVDDVLPADSLVVLYGRPGSAKSFVAQDLAFSVATGSWWFGRPVAQGLVLYVAGEGVGGLAQRTRAWQEARNIAAISDFCWLPQAVNLLDRKTGTALVELVDELQPVLIVVDTLARCMVGGDENAARDVGMAVEAVDGLRRATRASVLIVHHSGKDGGAVRGSSALEGAADAIIECRTEEGRVRLRCIKAKDAPAFDDIRLALVPTAGSCALYCQNDVAVPEELARSEMELLDAIVAASGSEGLSSSALLRTVEMSERTFYRSLKALREGGLVVNVGTQKQPKWAAASEVGP